MKLLRRGEKDDWKAGCDPNMIRTGCGKNIWDAIFWGFREYRDSIPSVQKKMINDKVRVETTHSPQTRWQEYKTILYDEYEKKKESDDEDEDRTLFFFLINPRLIESELSPYIEEILEDGKDWPVVEQEIVDKCCLLAEYRLMKKVKEEDPPIEDVNRIITSYTRQQLAKIQGAKNISYDDLQKACMNLEHHTMIISPNEKLLFDSFSWKDGIPGSDFWDSILIVAHPDNTYDSLGRSSFTKDQHQKISRIFHNDDILIETFRKKLV